MFAKIRSILGWAMIATLVLFIFFNRRPVTVEFFVGTVTMPAAFLILLSAALGAGAVQAMRFLKLFQRGRKP
jgi:uncharacterized integral membrane protein